jgi:DNA-binding response OmpR family regulator
MKIREMATNCATPVVFVTAHADFGNRAQSTLSGGNDFIAKPFLSTELAVKAFTCLFRESSPVPANPAVPVRAETRESQPSVCHSAPSAGEELVLEPNTAP